MIYFDDSDGQIVLAYSSEQSGPSWLDDKLESVGEATLSHTFTVRKEDLVGRVSQDEFDYFDEDVRRFVIGTVDDEYRTIRKRVLGLKHDLLIAGSIGIGQRTFIAERNISIFRRIDEIVDEQIVVGGPRMGAIPEDEFARLLHDFPTSTEITHYARTRITRVLREYLDTMSDAESRLAVYMERRARSGPATPEEGHGRIPVASELELEKFTYVRDRLAEMLNDAESYLEADWQAAVGDLFLLIFPQYVAVLHNVHVKERYSNESRSTDRYIDLMLVGANGCVDIIEIKKPFERGLVSKRQYRDNYIPVRELSGSIMQTEKYLFYLSKSGMDGENAITMKHVADLPVGLEVKIANPKAIILSGRDNNLSTQEKFDFEFTRRLYSNVVDIISYDDLLRRLDNVIAALTKRVGAESGPESDDQIGMSA
ncbi:Shedu immune nuclease family protein [Occultella kanbiaonis]|uniref:Shedu immune nuclease family protein n=1 Tax=Occultella kanbiaonis TaxID=2675754 RepID=UPI0013CFBB72|nr:Shedu immune nuclease family protein [Occultella kanbiaonis]